MRWVALAVSLLAGAGEAAQYELMGWRLGGRDTYITVPPTRRYDDATLQVTLANPGGRAVPHLLLDDRPVGPPLAVRDGHLRFRLPALLPGVHSLRLRPAPGVRPSDGCATGEAPLPIAGAFLSFTPTVTRPALLRELPGVLFHPQGTTPSVGNVDLGEWNDVTLGAALTLVQALEGGRPVLWQDARRAALPADFTLALRRDPALPVPARLELAGEVLRVTYRDPGGLRLAVHTLATPALLGRLAHTRVNLGPPVPAPRATLPPPITLSDYGVGDYEVANFEQTEQALRIPPYWEARTPARGELVVALPKGAGAGRVWVRVDEHTTAALAGAGTGRLRLAFSGQRRPARNRTGLVVGAQGLGGCEAAVRVDARATTLEAGLRPRRGLAGLPGALLAAPTLRLPNTPEAVTLALNVASSLGPWGLRGPLGWQGDLGGERGPATLTIGLDPALPPGGHLTARTEDGRARYTLGAATGPDLLTLAHDWGRVPAQMADRLTGATVEPGGRLVPTAAQGLRVPSPDRLGAWLALLLSALGLSTAVLWRAVAGRTRPQTER